MEEMTWCVGSLAGSDVFRQDYAAFYNVHLKPLIHLFKGLGVRSSAVHLQIMMK